MKWIFACAFVLAGLNDLLQLTPADPVGLQYSIWALIAAGVTAAAAATKAGVSAYNAANPPSMGGEGGLGTVIELSDFTKVFRGPELAAKLIGKFSDQISRGVGRFISSNRGGNKLMKQGVGLAESEVLKLFQGGQQFLGSLLPLFAEGAATGFRSDTEAIKAARRAEFGDIAREDIPEAFSGQIGSFSTDFGRAQLDALGDLERDLAQIDFSADEAAANRRLTTIPQAGVFATAPTSFALSTATDLFGLGKAQKDDRVADDFRALQALGALTGIEGQQRFYLPTTDPQISASTANTAALAETIPAFVGSTSGVAGI
jgi:hypothetical protein